MEQLLNYYPLGDRKEIWLDTYTGTKDPEHPWVMIDSGTWNAYGRRKDYYAYYTIYKNAVDYELSHQAAQAEVESYAWRVVNHYKFSIRVKNLLSTPLSADNFAAISGMVYEDVTPHYIDATKKSVTSRLERALVSVPLTILGPGEEAFLMLETGNLSNVNWNKLHPIAFIDYRPGQTNGPYNMLQAAISDQASFRVVPNPISFNVSENDPTGPSVLLDFKGPFSLNWTASESIPWLSLSSISGPITAPPTISIDKDQLVNGGQSGEIFFTATSNDSDNFIFTAQVPVTVFYRAFRPSLTLISKNTGTVGAVTLKATAAIANANHPTQKITFKLYAPADQTCSGTPDYAEDADLNGSSASTLLGFIPNSAGTWHWIASYPGDAENTPASTECAAGAVLVNKASPTINLQRNPQSGTFPIRLQASANLSGAYAPTGRISFRLYDPNDATCSGYPFDFPDQPPEVISLNGTSASTVRGTLVNFNDEYNCDFNCDFRWMALYAGDKNNNATYTNCSNGKVTISANAQPTLSITISGGDLPVILQASASLSGANNPTGAITFKIYPPTDSTCTGSPANAPGETVPISAASASVAFASTTIGYSANMVGDWHWTANYSGDGVNAPASTSCSIGMVTVGKAKPTISINPDPKNGNLGMTLQTAATLSGAFNPTGSITFELYSPVNSTCSGDPDYSQNAPINGSSATTISGYPANISGDWHWMTLYPGDEKNGAIASSCPEGIVTISKNQPSLDGAAVTPVRIGDAISDQAIVSGLGSPTGNARISYTLYSDNACKIPGLLSPLQSNPVSANGIYTSPSYFPNLAGTYYWVASFPGDDNNLPASTSCNEPSQTSQVNKAAPALTINPTLATNPLTLHASVNVTGGYNPTGSVIFSLYPPQDQDCRQASVYSESIPIDSPSIKTVTGFLVTVTGDWLWTATYAGDINNQPANTPCQEGKITVALPTTEIYYYLPITLSSK